MKAEQMNKNKVRHRMTWLALAVILTAGLGLIILSWNGVSHGKSFPGILLICWLLSSISGIYLFVIGADATQRKLRPDEQEKKAAPRTTLKNSSEGAPAMLDVAAKARKMARIIPEDVKLEAFGKELMQILSAELEIMSAALYCRHGDEFTEVATFALNPAAGRLSFREGETLPGQVAKNRQTMVLTRLPEGYLEVISGLGKAEPAYLAIVPITISERTEAVLECAGYRFDPREIEKILNIFAAQLSDKLSANKAQ